MPAKAKHMDCRSPLFNCNPLAWLVGIIYVPLVGFIKPAKCNVQWPATWRLVIVLHTIPHSSSSSLRFPLFQHMQRKNIYEKSLESYWGSGSSSSNEENVHVEEDINVLITSIRGWRYRQSDGSNVAKWRCLIRHTQDVVQDFHID